ncbi:uncharacterized protein B0P05DRAFT_558733 [Gilbertella persicaria]|uniref:uncharacterized protein n=1 Tax=Gilbertella persicaria TaxID=101096 RepID=UPI00221E8F2C|nr:uncharacterized protein B0P05DRAFT_558733 [Gilbertella persicaria]KAI8059025.1 hypothetical protein B0P05DRAFT_558733 [Gilbertella persicaria]
MSGKDYSAVPPPPSLAPSESKGSAAPAAPVNFNDALSKARAIAEKLKQQSAGNMLTTPSTVNTATNTAALPLPLLLPLVILILEDTKGYDDDRDSYRSSSRSYGSYQNERDNKRSAYDGGSSRPSYGGSSSSKRYGLGSEERKSSYHSSGYHHQEEYSVPNHMVGLLIGKGGENLKKIERMSGVTKVQFASDPVGDQRPVHLTGEPDQIAVARDMIRQMVADAQANENMRYGGRNDYGSSHNPSSSASGTSAGSSGGNTVTIRIPVSKVGLVIGRGGETIRDFEERSKAKILIASDSTGDRDNERVITLVGDDSATQHAKSLVEDIVFGSNNAGPSRSWNDSSYGVGRNDERAFITVPSSAVGLIIGRGGETVRAIQEQSGARVKVDPTSDPNAKERTVNISGDSKAVSIAKQMVEEKVSEATRGRGGYQQDYGNNYPQQYNQYYGQYGYDQYGDNSGYQQYPDYYNYQQGGEQEDGQKPPVNSENKDTKDGKEIDDNGQNNPDDQMSAYYAQYYGGQQPTQEQQEAYYQWYQQYYGQQYYNQQQSEDQQDNAKNPSIPTESNEDVDGEAITGEDAGK